MGGYGGTCDGASTEAPFFWAILLLASPVMSARPFSRGGEREQRDNLRAELFAKQNGLCHLCGKLMTLQRKGKLGVSVSALFATFDHLLPRALGGTAYYTNLALAHRKCNSARGHKLLAT